ncbi:CYCD1.4 protein [Gonium pectorale]|uniref:CYCD1.4 protein n=1 Tax=Gonium pectorale TaxID=33097 RepID=A0A150FZX5_GONPE|nr:CYCD1.4 protein [Gonium pectorale]|eukprot:KXZ43144.1 CYCD1.4 protein [Gonium pectorale]
MLRPASDSPASLSSSIASPSCHDALESLLCTEDGSLSDFDDVRDIAEEDGDWGAAHLAGQLYAGAAGEWPALNGHGALPPRPSLRFKLPDSSTAVAMLRLDHAPQRNDPAPTVPTDPTVIASPDASAAASGDAADAHRRLPEPHRRALAGWMLSAAASRGLELPTLAAAVELLDRFVEVAEVGEWGPVPAPDCLLQLLAMACLSLASKYVEGSRLLLRHWTSLAVDEYGLPMYEDADLSRMELCVLRALGWRLHTPTPATCLLHMIASCSSCSSSSSSGGGGRGGVAAAVATATPSGNASRTAAEAAEAAAAEQGLGPAAAAGGGAAARGAAVAAAAAAAASEVRLRRVADAAAALVELSLLCDAFLSYEPATVAAACLTLAERVVDAAAAASAGIQPPSPPYNASAASAAAGAAAAVGLSLDGLAPRLGPCLSDLEAAYLAARGA